MGSPSYAEQLGLAGRVAEPAIRQAMREFNPLPGSRGLDVGCGDGGRTRLLAEDVGEEGRVVGLDVSPENLAAARKLCGRSPHSGRIEFVRADLRRTPFGSGSFDWLWCADTLWTGFIREDPVDLVGEFARMVRPGGSVGLLYWSGQTFLPGYPALEARLDRAFAETTPYLAGVSPERHFLRALAWLERAGLERLTAKSFVAEWSAPLSPEIREGLAFCFQMFWGELEPHMSPGDWSEFRRLCDSRSDDCILDQPGYYAFLTYTLFRGRVRL